MTKTNEKKWNLAETVATRITPELCHEGQTAEEAHEYCTVRRALLRLPLTVLEKLAENMDMDEDEREAWRACPQCQGNPVTKKNERNLCGIHFKGAQPEAAP